MCPRWLVQGVGKGIRRLSTSTDETAGEHEAHTEKAVEPEPPHLSVSANAGHPTLDSNGFVIGLCRPSHSSVETLHVLVGPADFQIGGEIHFIVVIILVIG